MDIGLLLNTVFGSSPADWERVHSWPLDGFDPDPEGFDGLERAVLQTDIDIALAWGTTLVDDFREPWANNNPDPSARSFNVYILHNGAPVYADFLVSVDGGRCYLPPPRGGSNLVPTNRFELAQLLDGIERPHGEFRDYFERSGLETEG